MCRSANELYCVEEAFNVYLDSFLHIVSYFLIYMLLDNYSSVFLEIEFSHYCHHCFHVYTLLNPYSRVFFTLAFSHYCCLHTTSFTKLVIILSFVHNYYLF